MLARGPGDCNATSVTGESDIIPDSEDCEMTAPTRWWCYVCCLFRVSPVRSFTGPTPRAGAALTPCFYFVSGLSKVGLAWQICRQPTVKPCSSE